jgi:mono/diheme cytochrome c family protein
LADPLHLGPRVGAPPGLAPLLKLLRHVGCRLTGQRRVAGSETAAVLAVAGGAGAKAAVGVALVIEREPLDRSADRGEGQGAVVGGDRKPLATAELARNPTHLRVPAPAIGIGFHLGREVARVEPSQARGSSPVARAVEPVAGEAGVSGPGPRAAQRDQLAGRGKALGRRGISRTGGQDGGQSGGDRGASAHVFPSTRGSASRFRWPLAALLLTACKPPPENRQAMPQADTGAGLAAIERAGCGACHTIPGLYWPKGRAGPHLGDMTGRALIAGRLPNRPEVLAAFVRNAPGLVPGTSMPAMPLSETEARDVAAYLYAQDAS